MPSPTFEFDRRTQRYRYTSGSRNGQFVSDAQVRNLTEKAIGLVEKDILTIADLLKNNKISVATWEQETASALKTLHTWNYLLGKGGEKNMSQRDYELLSANLKFQYGYLRGFSEALTSTGLSEAQFDARLRQYLSASKQSYEEARYESFSNAGYGWEKRIRTKTESCDDCYRWAGMGWQPIGTLPNKGERCECRANCGCYKQYSFEPKGDRLLQSWGWLCDNRD